MQEYCETSYVDSDNRGIKFIFLAGQSTELGSIVDHEECFDPGIGKTGSRSLDSDILQVLATHALEGDFEVDELDEEHFVHKLLYSLSGADTTEIIEALGNYSNEKAPLTEVRGYLNEKLTLMGDSYKTPTEEDTGEPIDDGNILDDDDIELIPIT